jgi:hypothetical protein
MAKEGIHFLDGIAKDKLMFYQTFLLGKMDPQTAKKYTTAVRQLLKFCEKIEWIRENLWHDFHLPKKPKRTEIEIIPPEVVQEILACDWGKNPFTISRNKLIVNLLLRRGLHPKEFPTILMTDIHPYEDLAYLHVYGKRNVPRDVMLDEDSFFSLKDYAIKRAYYVDWRRIHDDHLLLSLIPRNGLFMIATSCIQSIVRRIKHELQLRGCLWDLSHLNPQGCRRTAETAEFERAEYLPIPNAHLSIIGQFGHSMRVAERHYWKKSKRNAYFLLKAKPDLPPKSVDKPKSNAFEPLQDLFGDEDEPPTILNGHGADIK